MRTLFYILFCATITFITFCGESPTETETLYFRVSGRNMQYWQTELGDETSVGSEEQAVTIADIRTDHKSDHSEVRVNIKNRKIQAQNVNDYSKTDAKALNITHNAAFIFSLAHKPASSNAEQNGDIIQTGLYVRDASTSNNEYAVAMRWVVNPWRADYGNLYTWNGSEWKSRATINPDSLDHTVEISLDRISQSGVLKFDNYVWQDAWSSTPISGEENGVTARLEFMASNAYPLETDYKPSFTVNFKNWKWEWAL